jgi:hypothetical protein
MKFLGVNNREAKLYSKYIFMRYYYNKIIDKTQDPTVGLIGHSLKILAKIIKVISKPFVRDKYGIEAKLQAIEEEMATWNNSKKIKDPLPYFRKYGEAYGLILKKGAMLSNKDIVTSKQMEIFGQNIGMIITMRDSIQDLKQDRITGSFNPFFYWKKADIIDYYNHYSRIIRRDILIAIQKNNSKKPKKVKTKSKTNLFTGIGIFAALANNPYAICKFKLNPKSIRKAVLNLLSFRSQEEPETPPEYELVYSPKTHSKTSKTRCELGENCAFDCCASQCEDCCYCGPKTEGQRACCQACDACGEGCEVCEGIGEALGACAEGCGGCAEGLSGCA